MCDADNYFFTAAPFIMTEMLQPFPRCAMHASYVVRYDNRGNVVPPPGRTDVVNEFLRKGYFTLDPDSTDKHLIFDRTVTLRDGWKKAKGK